jgi:hypothetical protein
MAFLKPIAKDLQYRLRSTTLRAPLVWFRHRGLTVQDVFLASYPRSGNTWMRFLLCEVLTGDADFKNVGFLIPNVRRHAKGAPLLSGGRLIKTHERYRREYKKAIYFIRDPRDVAVSYYEFDNPTNKSLDDFVNLFVHGRSNSFGSWQRHVQGWLDSPLADSGDLLIIKYEDMRLNIEDTVGKALEFLGVSTKPGIIRQAIANNSLQRLRAKEQHALAAGVSLAGQPIRGGGRYIRNGSTGEWRERLTERQARLIEDHAGELLARLGYSIQPGLSQTLEPAGCSGDSVRPHPNASVEKASSM